MNDKNINIENTIVIDFPPTPEEKDYVVCYIDFLGTKNIIKQKEQSIYNEIYETIAIEMKITSKMKSVFGDLKIKVFSDNILISHEIEDSKNKNDVFRA